MGCGSAETELRVQDITQTCTPKQVLTALTNFGKQTFLQRKTNQYGYQDLKK